MGIHSLTLTQDVEFRWGASQDDHGKRVLKDIALTAAIPVHTFKGAKIMLLLARCRSFLGSEGTAVQSSTLQILCARLDMVLA